MHTHTDTQGGLLSHRGTPSSHPYRTMGFSIHARSVTFQGLESDESEITEQERDVDFLLGKKKGPNDGDFSGESW